MKKSNNYSKLITFIIVVILIITIITMGIFSFLKPKPLGKIAAPIEAKPITYLRVKYTAPLDDKGIVIAYDEKTGIKLWEKRIYVTKIDPNLEEDVQWVFIKELKIEDHYLRIINTKGEIYSIDVYGEALPPIVTKIK